MGFNSVFKGLKMLDIYSSYMFFLQNVQCCFYTNLSYIFFNYYVRNTYQTRTILGHKIVYLQNPVEFPKECYIWIWDQQDWEANQEIDGKDEVTEDGRTAGGEGWQEKVRNRQEWKKLLKTARNRHILPMPMERMNEWWNVLLSDIH